MDEKEIIGAFNASRQKPAFTQEGAPPLVYMRAMHDVATALKANGADVTLDMRPGLLGCPQGLRPAKASVMANGTLVMDGQAIDFVVQNVEYTSYLLMYVDGGKILQYSLLSVGNGQWNPNSSNLTPAAAIATALGVQKSETAQCDSFDIVPPPPPEPIITATDERITVSQPLKIKTNRASA